MNTTGSGSTAFKAILLAGLMLGGGMANVWAEPDVGALTDLKRLPAMKVASADHSVQLAVARAGNRLVSVGEQGIILLSDDDGRHWRQADFVPVSVTLTDVEFVSDTEGWAVGHSGVVLRTATAGDTWERVMTGKDLVRIIQDAVSSLPDDAPNAKLAKRNASYLGGNEPLLDAYFAPSGESWLLGAYGIALRSDDGGDTWSSAFSATGNRQSYHLYQFIPTAGSQRIIVGERGTVSLGTAGDEAFEQTTTGYDGTFFGGLPVGGDEYLLYGLRGNVRIGNRSGWREVDTGSEASFSSAVKTPAGVILGDVTGRLFLKTDDGDELRELTQASEAAITDLQLSSEGALVMSTARGLKRLNIANTEFK